jgi:superfamily II DNA or RNA helicase
MNPDTPAVEPIKPLHEIETLDDYLKNFGRILGKKAITSLAPLHVPGQDPLPSFDDMLREPFDPQKHVVAAAVKMMDEVSNGFVVGEMGTGKTLIGMTSIHRHASRPRSNGGRGGNYRALVLCPDHLIGKWKREIEETIPGATVHTFGPVTVEDEAAGKKKDEGRKSGTAMALADTVNLFGHRAERPGGAAEEINRGARWAKPEGAEWYILGRNQAKWYPEWRATSDPYVGFGRVLCEKPISGRVIPIEKVAATDDMGKPVYKNGKQVFKYVTDRVFACPACGHVPRNKQGIPLSDKDLGRTQHRCEGKYLQEIAGPERPKGQSGRDRIRLPSIHGSKEPGSEVNHGGKKYLVRACGEMLWNWTSKPYRWAPARLIHKKLKRFFNYLIIDEVHEQKSDESAQSMAAGKLMASVDHTVALTGTIIGGYASHLFPLMVRMTPETLIAEGFEWGKDLAFSEVYGRIDTIVSTKEECEGPSVSKRSVSMRRARSGKSSMRKAVRPGIMPTLFGRHMIGSSIFITLEEMADELPDLDEFVEDGACDMTWEQELEYQRVEEILTEACRELLKRGSAKLLGAMLWTLLDYPDKPYGWEHDPEVRKAIEGESGAEAPGLLGQSFLRRFNHQFDPKSETLILTRPDSGETDRIPLKKDGGIYWLDVTFNGKTTKSLAYDTGASSIALSGAMASDIGLKANGEATAQIADGSTVPVKTANADSVTVGKFTVANVECTIKSAKLPHTVGYWNLPNNKQADNWVGVVTPKSLDPATIYPKERKLIDLCLAEKKAGNQVWVYVNMTGKRNIQPRLKSLLEAHGLKVGVLRSGDVDPKAREDWIAKHGREFDVMISHPKLVSTGLDLFSKAQGGHNYSTIVFYQTGYNLFDLRQAARRAWRIGQPKGCKVYYLYYRGTMQHRAMDLMSKKMAAAQALEGEFSADGLAAMAGEDNLQMALAKNLSEQIDDQDMQRSWSKVKSGAKKVKRPTDGLKALAPPNPEPSPLDVLPVEERLIAETILDEQEDAKAGLLPDVADEIAKVRQDIDRREASKPKLRLVEPEPEEDDDFEMPELTPEILAKMFANLAGHGFTPEEFFDQES